jgi:hypothetical protein
MLLLKCEPGNTLGPHREMRNSDVILIITPKWRKTCYFEIILDECANKDQESDEDGINSGHWRTSSFHNIRTIELRQCWISAVASLPAC